MASGSYTLASFQSVAQKLAAPERGAALTLGRF
ncbi:hypothetical protein U2A4042360166 [Corynebacterium striatum]|nr:hypothetical protein U2A4042360166 [Corynebacterium striatum]